MGYDTVAINIDVGDIAPSQTAEEVLAGEDDLKPPPSKKQRKALAKAAGITREQHIPEPFIVDEELLDLTSLEQQGKRFRQFSRLTFTLNDASVIHNVFHNPRLKKFDLIAVRPGDENILNTLTRKTDPIDIVTFDHEAEQVQVPWLMKFKFMEQIRLEGIGFELSYASILKDSSVRRQVLSHGRRLIHSLKGRGVVFSSGAESVIDLRGPADVMNMLCLWQVSRDLVRPMISNNAREVLLRCEARRTIRGALHITKLETWENEEGGKSISGNVPSGSKGHSEALSKLLSIKHFRAQVEVVPPKPVVEKMDSQ